MLEFCAQTDIGKRRSLNEDSIFAQDQLFLVCDGMGGHKAGEVASQLAVETITRFIARSGDDLETTWPYGFHTRSSLDENRLRTAIKLANRAVARQADSADEYTGMGTTVAAALVSRTRPEFVVANVGDSRVYLIRGGEIRQISIDDSWANLVGLAEGADPDVAISMQHVLTKALGARGDVGFDVKTLPLEDADCLLLCSDGLTNMLSDDRMLEIVQRHGADVQSGCRELIDQANEAGGRGNISSILVRYRA